MVCVRAPAARARARVRVRVRARSLARARARARRPARTRVPASAACAYRADTNVGSGCSPCLDRGSIYRTSTRASCGFEFSVRLIFSARVVPNLHASSISGG